MFVYRQRFAIIQQSVTFLFCKSSGGTYRSRVDAGNDGIPFLTLSNRIVIDTEFLGNEMDDPPLLGREGSRER